MIYQLKACFRRNMLFQSNLSVRKDEFLKTKPKIFFSPKTAKMSEINRR
jgi:hypothetical protein